jgi:hypothetical protein
MHKSGNVIVKIIHILMNVCLILVLSLTILWRIY